MRRSAAAMSVVILAFTIIIQAQTKSESLEQELTRLENDWADAMVKTDLAFLERHLSDDYVEWGPYGTSMTKADIIASLKSGDLMVVSIRPRLARAKYGTAVN